MAHDVRIEVKHVDVPLLAESRCLKGTRNTHRNLYCRSRSCSRLSPRCSSRRSLPRAPTRLAPGIHRHFNNPSTGTDVATITLAYWHPPVHQRTLDTQLLIWEASLVRLDHPAARSISFPGAVVERAVSITLQTRVPTPRSV